MPKPVEKTGTRASPYRPGLDGLRAIAVAGVFLSHSLLAYQLGCLLDYLLGVHLLLLVFSSA